MSGMAVAPFDFSRYIGSVCHVRPTTLEVNLPKAAATGGGHYAGYSVPAGQVGEFVVVEGEDHAVLGRLMEVRLPERDRLTVEPTSASDGEPSPIGVVQILTAIDLTTGRALNGVPAHPRIGQHVYSAHPLVVKQAVEAGGGAEALKIQLAVFPHAQNTSVSLSPSSVFGRHCAVLGATGGGKSWTLAKLMEEIIRLEGKAILLDATGEFHSQTGPVKHVHLGGKATGPDDVREFISFPYYYLTETDLFVLFRPSMGAQAPKLKEALRSLKLAALAPTIATAGAVKKAGAARQNFEAAMRLHEAALLRFGTRYDIARLPQQIWEECVYPTGFDARAATHWGGAHPGDQAYCTSLISRIEAEINSESMACVFQPGTLRTLPEICDEFFLNDDSHLLRVSLEHLPFEHNTRELVSNAVGRYLLGRARLGRFKKMPLVVLLDEAHQFLDKTIGDENNRASLDSFGLIAKEGRKYGLTCVLATQRPRDIPEDVLSQMGMFIVHRLINERDRAVVEKACGNLDASAASFLPTLGQGEAILIGVESPMPLPVLVRRPLHEPVSRGPDYEQHWGKL
ncbi:ATP-binding protein [Caenimonas soli]|uniref:ATP-binding protein n=1 Tax=Caenimonas soli TaxID=2735555 RepID=UPI001553BF80|nr:ATP-binding protein [Caenimonas soli]NPC57825.1 ATP-binding protein [Caenimonas soli]